MTKQLNVLELNDENKNLIEVVLIPSKSHNTICVSVQVDVRCQRIKHVCIVQLERSY